jgi:hypothetical protein
MQKHTQKGSKIWWIGGEVECQKMKSKKNFVVKSGLSPKVKHPNDDHQKHGK